MIESIEIKNMFASGKSFVKWFNRLWKVVSNNYCYKISALLTQRFSNEKKKQQRKT